MTANAAADDVWNKYPLLNRGFFSCAGFKMNSLHDTLASGDMNTIPEKDILSWPRLAVYYQA